MKVNVLGVDYTIKYQDQKENVKLKDNAGLCEMYSKEILLNFDELDDPSTVSNVEEYKKQVLRHELLHAFMFESGAHEYCRDEELIELLAIQCPKIYKAMQETKCL